MSTFIKCDKCEKVFKDDDSYYKFDIEQLNNPKKSDGCYIETLDFCKQCYGPIFNYMTKK